MAIYNKISTGGNGVPYTKECDSSADYPNIANLTYFKNLSDQLIYYKNAEGIVIPPYAANKVIFASAFSLFPAIGLEGYMYVDNTANAAYLWDTVTATYIKVGTGPAVANDPTPLAFANGATIGALSYSPTYYNGPANDGVDATLIATVFGAITDSSTLGNIDYTYVPVVGEYILVKDQSAQQQNGLYEVVNTGSASAFYSLIRVAEYNESIELFPLQVSVLFGQTNALKYFTQITANPVIGNAVTGQLIFKGSSLQAPPFQIAFVDTATTEALPTCVYTNGLSAATPGLNATLQGSVNGVLPIISGLTPSNTTLSGANRILVKNQADPSKNGDYVVVTPGSATSKWLLRRINSTAEAFDRYTRVYMVSNLGSTLAGKIYFASQNNTRTNLTIGTPTTGNITFSEYGSSNPLAQSNTIYVDSVNGLNAVTGRGDINTPYLTVEYALSNTTNTGTITGNTATSITISGISDVNNASLKVGQNIGGTGIPFNTIIIAKGNQGGNANTITISKPATATATGVTITWITSFTLLLSGTFIATSNWFKQGMLIDAQTSNISWSGFTLFNNTTLQIMSYALLGNGNYYGASAANTKFFNYQVAQTSEFICNINYDIINTNDTGAIFNGNMDQGQLIIKGNLARASFGSVTSFGNTYITFYSSTYGLLGGHSLVNQAHLNLVGGVHQTPSSVNVLSGSISYFNTECTLIGSTSPQAVWTHIGGLFGTTLNFSGGSLNCYGSGTIYASGGSISGYYGNVGNLDLVVSGNVELNGDIRGAGVNAGGRLINNGSIGIGVTMNGGTLINNGHISPLGGAWVTVTATSAIYNYGYMNITIWGMTGGTWENRGTMELTSYGQVTTISGGTFRNYGLLRNVSKDTDVIQLSGTGVVENYGTIQNTNVNTTSAIIKKTGGTLKLYPGSILKVANGLSPIWCVNNDSASKDIYLFNCITNCNGTSYGLGYAFTGGFVPNDLVGGVEYENVNY